MSSFRFMAGAFGAALLLAVAPEASAQSAQTAPPSRPLRLEVMVSHFSQQPGKIDPRAVRFHRILSSQFRYESVKVIESRRFNLKVNETGNMELPTGRSMSVRPVSVSPKDVVVAVDVEQTIRTDLRMRNRNPVVIGVQPYDDGKLVIILESDLR